MKNLSDLTKNLKAFHYGTTLNASRDWLVALTITIVLMLASVAWNLWTFDKVIEGAPIGTETASQPTNTGSTDTVVNLFEARAAEETRYRSEYRFVDPSTRAR